MSSWLGSRESAVRKAAALTLAVVAGVAVAGPPSPPVALKPPSNPITWGSGSVGYLPGSGSVSMTGSYGYTIPIDVPPGRGGMAPALSLAYSSGSPNGVLGVGWALAGLSAIARCGQSLSTEGVSNGVHVTDFSSTLEPQRDRFCLDGRKLVATHGAYGQDQTEYRTEEDAFVRVVSNGSSAQGPDSFTVSLPNGRVLTFRAPTVPQYQATANGLKLVAQVRMVWLLAEQVDLSGNGISYTYKSTTSEDGQGTQVLLSSIDYTTFKGDTAGAYRHVTFAYESRPDQEFSWQAGVKSQLVRRLTSITVSAPNPGVSEPVWEYLLAYQAQPSGFSGRSLLASVQRCSLQGANGKTPGAVGDCVWKKQFAYTTGSATPTFTKSSVASATNVDITPIIVSGGAAPPFVGPEPAVKVLDADGDGVDDVLFQAGQPQWWTDQAELYAENASCQPGPDNNYNCPSPPRMIAPTLMLGTHAFGATSNPLLTAYDLSIDYGADLYSFNNSTGLSAGYYGGGYYPWAALENLSPVDLDGNGKSSIFMAAPVGAGGCTFRALDWGPYPDFLGIGMKDRGVAYPLNGNCTNWGSANQKVQYFFTDADGDRRADVSTFTTKGQDSSNIQTALSLGANFLGPWSPPTQPPQGLSAGCPFYAVDFAGDGRAGLFGQVGTSGAGCGESATYTYSPFDGSYSLAVDGTAAMPDLPVGVPGSSSALACPDGTTKCRAGAGYDPRPLFFGDFNGDGLADVVSLDPSTKNLFLSWNTGNGFGPAKQLASAPWTAGSYKVVVADMNRDGRADLVVFHDLPARAITLMLSKGDGTFAASDVPNADPGVNTPEGWTSSAVGDFNGDGVPDIVELTGAAPISAVQIIQNPPPAGSFCGPFATTSSPTDPCAVNAYQVSEIVKGTLQTLMQPTNAAAMAGSSVKQPAADLLTAVQDEGAALPRETVSYASANATPASNAWSDKPDPASCSLLSYPQHCLTKGLTVVRSVTSNDTLANTASTVGHVVQYSYERPAADLRGRGFLGFGKVRVWDPTRLQQTTTLYENTSEAGTLLPPPVNTDPYGPNVYFPPLYAPGFYPGVGRPKTLTTVTMIPASGSSLAPTMPEVGAGKANARVVRTDYQYQTVTANGGKTFMVWPKASGGPAVVRAEWEQLVAYAPKVTDPANPGSDYVWNVSGSAPAGARVTSTAIDALDAYGNVRSYSVQTSVGGEVGALTQVASNYKNLEGSPWLIGLLMEAKVTVTEPDPAVKPVTRKMGYGYDASGRVQTVTSYQVVGSSSTAVSTTTLGRDAYGNVISSAVSALGPKGTLETREVDFEYDPLWPGQPNERIFLSQRWSPVSLPAGGGKAWTPSSWTLTHPAYGVLNATMDVNGVQASARYDGQARLVTTLPPVGASTTVQYSARVDAPQGGTNGVVVTTSTAGQVSQALSDAAGRTLQQTALGYDGTVVTGSYVRYDLLGRPVASWRPYSGTALPWTLSTTFAATTTYDGLDRVLKTVGPDGQPTTLSYTFLGGTEAYPSGFTRTVNWALSTDPSGYQSRTSTDLDGRLVATANYLTTGGSTVGWVRTLFHFAPFDQADAVTLPSGAQETTAYDTLGQVVGHFSPDLGTASGLAYDGFGELLTSTHKESGAVTTHDYDALGRTVAWTTVDGAVATSAAFTYDTQPFGLGKLATTGSSDGVATTHGYDTFGRLVSTKETINGKAYTIARTFDANGRLSQVQYPAVGTNPNPGFTLQHAYNASGYLSSLTDTVAVPGGTGTLPGYLLAILSRNADGSLASAVATNVGWLGMGQYTYAYVPETGQLKQATYTSWASSPAQALMDLTYSYAPNGLVKSRLDTVNGRLEQYTYDSMSRLSDWSLGTCSSLPCTPASAPTFRHYAYDLDGNMTSVVAYGKILNLPVQLTIQTNTYGPLGGSNGGPQGGPHALDGMTLYGTSSTISYDAHGRVVDNGTGRKVNYNGFDLPRSVTQPSGTWKFQYDAFGQRVVKTGPDGTTVSVGGVFEKRFSAGSATVIDVFRVTGLAQVETNESTGVTSTLYTMTDPLGTVSTVVQGQVVNNVVTEQALTTNFFEPFGARINKDGTAFTGAVGEVHDGFTGQEHDDALGLINFKGRLYDPTLRRFMSGDPHLTHPGFGQSWNPYSYALNSPLTVSDPTGFDDTAPGPVPLAPGSEDDTDYPVFGQAPSQAAIAGQLPDGWTPVGAPYPLYDSGSGVFVSWQVNLQNGEGTTVYWALAGFPEPTRAAPAPGPTASARPAPSIPPGYVPWFGITEADFHQPISMETIKAINAGFNTPASKAGLVVSGVGIVATVGALGGLAAEGLSLLGSAVSSVKAFVGALGSATGVTPLLNSGRAAVQVLAAGGGGMGLGTRLWVALNMAAAEMLGMGGLGAGAAALKAGSRSQSFGPSPVVNNGGAPASPAERVNVELAELANESATAEALFNNTCNGTCAGAALSFVDRVAGRGFTSGVLLVRFTAGGQSYGHAIGYAVMSDGRMVFSNYGNVYGSFSQAWQQTSSSGAITSIQAMTPAEYARFLPFSSSWGPAFGGPVLPEGPPPSLSGVPWP